MLIKLTNAISKDVYAISAGIIWIAERTLDNKLITRVVTTINGPKGLLAYDVMESPEEICDLIAQTYGKGHQPDVKPAAVLAQ